MVVDSGAEEDAVALRASREPMSEAKHESGKRTQDKGEAAGTEDRRAKCACGAPGCGREAKGADEHEDACDGSDCRSQKVRRTIASVMSGMVLCAHGMQAGGDY